MHSCFFHFPPSVWTTNSCCFPPACTTVLELLWVPAWPGCKPQWGQEGKGRAVQGEKDRAVQGGEALQGSSLGTACAESRIKTSNLLLMERLQEGIWEAIERSVRRGGQEMYGVSLPFIFQAHKVCRLSV